MENLVYVLFETDLQKSKRSRVFLGVYSSKTEAIDNAKKNDCYSSETEVVILECILGEFMEQ